MVHILILIHIPMKIRVKKMVMQLDRIIRPTMMLIIVMNIIRKFFLKKKKYLFIFIQLNFILFFI